ncbi:MAG: hypothetical protein HY815_03260 [Candidatus Riflebacteria bacterium]|nr:hypothetical protein [Candidatus Riflebacteria bacterium]
MNTLSLEGLSDSQIKLVEELVRYLRTKSASERTGSSLVSRWPTPAPIPVPAVRRGALMIGAVAHRG